MMSIAGTQFKFCIFISSDATNEPSESGFASAELA